MITPIPWKFRTFTFELPVAAFPGILERLRGTPARAAELMADISEEVLGTRVNGKWSAKENLGHLADLGELDERRLREFLTRAPRLSPADAENCATEAAGYNHHPVAVILERLRACRAEWVRKLEALTEEEVALDAVHPRLDKKMRIVDWAYFVAEHDDHHLALARRAMVEAANQPNSQDGEIKRGKGLRDIRPTKHITRDHAGARDI